MPARSWLEQAMELRRRNAPAGTSWDAAADLNEMLETSAPGGRLDPDVERGSPGAVAPGAEPAAERKDGP